MLSTNRVFVNQLKHCVVSHPRTKRSKLLRQNPTIDQGTIFIVIGTSTFEDETDRIGNPQEKAEANVFVRLG